eukprot:g7895.t1
MGCSSSRIPRNRPSTEDETSRLPATPGGAGAAGGVPPKVANSVGMDDLDGDNPDFKKTLILKKNQQSMEGRQNQSLVQNLVHDEFRRQITEVYDMNEGSLLGKGGFGTVQTVVHKESRKKYALKAVELSRVKDEKSLDFFFREVEVMRKLDHPNICRLHAVYPTVEHLFMVMDLCEGGDLLTTYHFKSEQDAANIVLKVTNAVRYMHDRNIAHRDLKLDNILTDDTQEGADVKLVDFGLSAHFQDFRLEHDVVGTWVYMAPEVISGSHFPRTCDMWSIGVIAYLLLCGYPPFGGNSTAELKEQIQHGTYQFHHDAWSSISGKAKNFIKRLLVRNPQERMSAAEAQHHPWLNNHDPNGGGQKLSKGALSNLVNFRNTNALKKLALELVARSLDNEQIRNLEKDFAKMDKDGSGTISLEEFDTVLSAQANLSKADIKALFASVDVDNGKELNFNEFLAATLERRQLDERRLKLAFDRLDFDHSGTIDATDLRNIVGSDLGQDEIDEIFKQFDLNSDGEIDFGEFKLAMRKADAPGVRLATYRSSSMPQLTLSKSIKHLEKTVLDANKQRQALAQVSTTGPTPEESVNDENEMDDDPSGGGAGGGFNRAVMRASLVRCASVLMENGQYLRRATLEVSDPAQQKAVREAALQENGVGGVGGALAQQQQQQQRKPLAELGPDPLAAIIRSRRSSDGVNSAEATKRAMDEWQAIPPQVEEEPLPWGHGEQTVTAATSVQKQLQTVEISSVACLLVSSDDLTDNSEKATGGAQAATGGAEDAGNGITAEQQEDGFLRDPLGRAGNEPNGVAMSQRIENQE